LLDQAVDVLEELPGQATLADTRLAGDGNETGAAFAHGRVVHILQETQLVVPTDEWRFETFGSSGAAPLCHDPKRSPRGNGSRLPLEHLLARRLEQDRPARSSIGRVADEHRARRS